MNCHDSLERKYKYIGFELKCIYLYINKFFVDCRFITMHGSSNFRQGGGGVGGGPGSADRKNPLTTFFIIFYLTLVLNVNLFSVILSFF